MKPERNAPCPCGSGKTFEKCCMEWYESAKPKVAGKKAAPTAAECNQLEALFNAGRLAELEGRARLLLEKYPESGFVWNLLGASLQMQGKDGLAALQNATKFLPNDVDAHSNLGNALSGLGRVKEAEASYRRALQIRPAFALAHNSLGITLHKMGRLAEAADSYRQALRINSGYSEAHYNLGITLSDLGRMDEAEACYRRVLQIRPAFALAHNKLGTILYKMGRLAEAADSYRQALQIKPAFALVHNNLGIALHKMGRLAEAADSYRQALRTDSDYSEAHYNLGNALGGLGRLEEAEAGYRQALQIRPDYADAYCNLGTILHKMGRLGEEVDSYWQALRIKSDYFEAHYNLGNVLDDLGRLEEAEASYRQALQIRPDHASTYDALGVVLMKQGKLNESLVCYQQLIRLTPGNDVARYMIAALTGSNAERPPAQYVERLFDSYADKFDTHLLHVLNYDAPEKLVALVKRHATTLAGKWNVLDLGCGTGLVGSAIAPLARQLVGVDLSAKMLEKAHARNLYQRLERLDLLTMMRAEKASSYDVIIAADVFIYLGKLDEVISEIKRLLCQGGFFAFSIETLEALPNEEASQDIQQEYQLESTGRYSHSPGYMTRLASANGFQIREMAATQLRMERGKMVNGYLVLWEAHPGHPV